MAGSPKIKWNAAVIELDLVILEVLEHIVYFSPKWPTTICTLGNLSKTPAHLSQKDVKGLSDGVKKHEPEAHMA
jgi:hypothetical protein